MKLVTQQIGQIVLEELAAAIEVRIAVAFFNPDEDVLAALAKLPKLTLVISEEFTITNPYKLEKLRTAKVRSIPPDDGDGKLHAKVLIIKRKNGSYWALVGSANVTWQGMFSNQEACIAMDSRDAADEEAVLETREWFDALLETAQVPDLEQAKQIFDARSQMRLVPRPPKETSASGIGYYALKTTSGSDGKQHWQSFLAENVIAIGWSDIPVNPAKASLEHLREANEETYPDEGDPPSAAKKIKKFVGLQEDDIILICRGYSSIQDKDVHIHGLARVTGPFRDDRRSTWDWRFKHDAVIQVIDMDCRYCSGQEEPAVSHRRSEEGLN